jgi:hypothetical protein
MERGRERGKCARKGKEKEKGRTGKEIENGE